MAGVHRAGQPTEQSLAISIHGGLGVLDLTVPAGATVGDLAREYAEQTGLRVPPPLLTRLGTPLEPRRALVELGLESGGLVVAVTGTAHEPSSTPRPAASTDRRELSALWFALAAALAVFGAWLAASTDSETTRTSVAAGLLGASLLGVLPLGSNRARRALAAPAFAAAAAYCLVYEPGPEPLPLVVGIAALAAALAAGIARALGDGAEPGLRVWMVAGAGTFVLAGALSLLGAGPEMFWAFLLLVALFVPRFVPALAVDVPDQYLIDLERLAMNAWSARQVPERRRRTVVPPEAVALVAARAAYVVTAASVAVLVAVLFAAPQLLTTATLPIDRIGARSLVFLAGAGLLLAARSYRHRGAQSLLRLAGLACWAFLVAHLVPLLDASTAMVAGLAVVVLAAALVPAAVATGRGWRSAWWSRRAEVAEGVCGAFAIVALLVAIGVFRRVWESVNFG